MNNTAILPLPYTKPPLSMNDSGASRGAAFAKASARKQIREDVCHLATLAWLPKGVEHVTVQLHYQPRDNRVRDTDNLWATLKPICDALTVGKAARISPRTKRPIPAQIGYGMVADDAPRWMAKPEPIIHPAVKGEPGSMWLELSWRYPAELAGVS
ncbi:hypothetical protein [Nocardia acidivorans]|uniref:hypothetical protein n=1 Tax=Nocardia acidivorans TaxID=404580 RepID=UPI00082E131F|nr:hypothetical protein [Nocardia acidivorans]